MAEPFVRIEGLTKRFGPIEALRSVDLTVDDGELLVVLGPTGAGKTTLLRTLAGLETPDAGRVCLADQDVTGLSPAQRDVALVFQNFSLYPNWTVRQNLAFPLKAPGRKLARDEITRRVEVAAEMLRITPLLDRKSTRLSGGEMQRVAIGRAIVRRPRVFLMDEPLTNLDAKLREQLRVELVCLQRELGKAMIFVTHDQAEALSMARRVAVLSEGRILQVATPEVVYRNPVSPDVARQLGQPAINLIAVTPAEGWWRAADGTSIAPADAGAPGPSLLGVRPEDVLPDGGAAIATVRIVEQMGPTKTLVLDWAGQAVHAVVPAIFAAAPGDTLRPSVRPGRVLIWPQ